MSPKLNPAKTKLAAVVGAGYTLFIPHFSPQMRLRLVAGPRTPKWIFMARRCPPRKLPQLHSKNGFFASYLHKEHVAIN